MAGKPVRVKQTGTEHQHDACSQQRNLHAQPARFNFGHNYVEVCVGEEIVNWVRRPQHATPNATSKGVSAQTVETCQACNE
eukprot:3080356-Amphidinium_carterae.1